MKLWPCARARGAIREDATQSDCNEPSLEVVMRLGEGHT